MANVKVVQGKCMNEENDMFPALSRRVIELVSRIRLCLFKIDAAMALRLRAECHSLLNATRKAEGESRSSLLVGICTPEERLHFVRAAQRFSRLGRIVHQAEQIVSSIPEIAGKVGAQDIESFKPIYMMAEVELRDAVLSILRDDAQLAHGVAKKGRGFGRSVRCRDQAHLPKRLDRSVLRLPGGDKPAVHSACHRTHRRPCQDARHPLLLLAHCAEKGVHF